MTWQRNQNARGEIVNPVTQSGPWCHECLFTPMYTGEPLELRVILNPSAPAQLVADPPAGAALNSQHPMPTTSSPITRNSELRTQNSELIPQPPAWITAERWAALPIMLRAALAGSTLVDDAVQARTPFLSRQLKMRYAREVGELIALP
jgi:hypothetical protein